MAISPPGLRERVRHAGSLLDREGRGALGVLLGVAVAVQVVQGVASRIVLNPYERSYWLVTYQAGFTRRGLAGEAVRFVTGSVASVPEIEMLQWLLTLSLVVALGLLARAAWRANRVPLDLAAVVLCCSPFVFDFVLRQRRPDEAGFAIVVFYGLAVYKYPRRAAVAGVAAGLALALAVLVQDAVFLECVPWVAAIALLSQPERVANRANLVRLSVLCGPATVAAGLSVAYGLLDARHVNELVAAASHRYSWVNPSTPSVFDYLADGVRASYQHVADIPLSGKVASLGVPAFLLVLQLVVFVGLRRARNGRRAVAHASPVALTVVAAVVALGALFVLGVDWTRWIGSFGLMATVTFAFALLFDGAAGEREPVPVALLVVVATYLVWLAPLPDYFVSVSSALRYVVMIPRIT